MILNFMLFTQESTLKTERKGSVHTASLFLIQHLEDSFDNTQGVDISSSVFESDQGQLGLMFDSGTELYTFSNSRIYYNGIPISPKDIVVTSFNLSPVYQGNTEIIGIIVNIHLLSPDDSDITEDINMLFTLR